MNTSAKTRARPGESPAQVVRRVREKLGMTQTEFAAKVGVYWLTISKWERGAKPVPPARLRAIKRM